jgi:hypothetical protein
MGEPERGGRNRVEVTRLGEAPSPDMGIRLPDRKLTLRLFWG